MWTRKAAFTFTGGVALILIGMMISNNQMMILGLCLIAFIVVNSWISGHGDVEVQRTLSADNLYKGDDLYVELVITNRSNRKTQLLEVYDNIPHEMKLRSGLNHMRLNLSPGESARIRYVLRCPLRGHYSIGPVSLRSRKNPIEEGGRESEKADAKKPEKAGAAPPCYAIARDAQHGAWPA